MGTLIFEFTRFDDEELVEVSLKENGKHRGFMTREFNKEIEMLMYSEIGTRVTYNGYTAEVIDQEIETEEY